MKHLLLFIALAFSLTSLPTTTFAKDKRDYYDDWKKSAKDLRNEADFLQKHYNLVKDRLKNMNGTRRQWDGLRDVRSSIDSIYGQLDSGRFDPRDVHNQIQSSHDSLNRIQADVDYTSKRHGGYYRPY